MPDLPLHKISSIIAEGVTGATGNHQLTILSTTCKTLHNALHALLLKRRVVWKRHRIGYCPCAASNMIQYRNDLRKDIEKITVSAGYNSTRQYRGEYTVVYKLRHANGFFAGEVAVSSIPRMDYWLEIELSSAGKGEFISQATLLMFPTYDTQGGFIAMIDNNTADGTTTRVRRDTAMDRLAEHIRRVCLS